MVATNHWDMTQCQLGLFLSSKQHFIIYMCPITPTVLYICALSQLCRLPLCNPSTLFSLSPSSPPAVLPSGHSPYLSSKTGYVASPEEINRASTTKYKQKHILNNQVHTPWWAFTWRKCEEKTTKKNNFHHNSYLSLAPFHFSPVLWLSPTHLFLVWGH